MAVLAYARTSTADKQVLDSQLDALEKHGYDRLFTDQQSGKSRENRPGLKAMLDFAREGDCIVVYSLSRLSRNLKDCIEISSSLGDRNIDLVSLTEGIDTKSPAGRMYYAVLCALNQLQREQLVEATKAGLDAARARGRVGGRPRKSADDIEQAIRLYESKEFSIKEIAKMTGVSASTLYRYLKQREQG